jgi:hypothetical protein
MRAQLFTRLSERFQRRDRLRMVIDDRRRFLESLVRHGEEDAGKVEHEYRQASTEHEREYEETAAAMKEKKELSAEEAAEVGLLWWKLVKLFHPDRFAHEPEKQETYHKLTAAINQAKDNGNLARLRAIAEDPHGFILRQGWAALTSAKSARSRSCAGCAKASSWKSSACSKRAISSRRVPTTNCTA